MAVPTTEDLQLFGKILRSARRHDFFQTLDLTANLLHRGRYFLEDKIFDGSMEMGLRHKMLRPTPIETFRTDRSHLLQEPKSLAHGTTADSQLLTDLSGSDRFPGHEYLPVNKPDGFGQAQQ